ncbi:hypothetical protein [Falsibacillus pallidus]
MGKEKDSLSEEIKKKDHEFDQKMMEFEKDIENIKKSIFKDKDK